MKKRARGLALAATILALGAVSFSAIVKGEQSPSALSRRLSVMSDTIARDGNSFSVGCNPALGYALEELCGLKEPPDWRSEARFRKLSLSADLPSAFDWRKHGIVPPVRDQASCGSCWAFGSVGPLEAAIKWKDGLEVDLSEQWLVSCNQSGWVCSNGWWAHDYHGGPNPLYGEDGGNGAVPESEFPYVASDVACGGSYSHPYKISSWSYISGNSAPSTDQIKQAIYTYGPVSAAICIGSYFHAYTGGIFDRDESGTINHAIVLVGWDDNNGQGYWILRNSWGEGWGEDGYMRIRYGMSQVGYSANYIIYTPSVPPEIEVSPLSLAAQAAPGGTASGALVIANTGQGSLEFSLGWEPETTRSGAGGPDEFGYSWKDSGETGGPAYAWAEIGSVGTSLALGDEGSALVNLPFSFPYYGQEHSSITVSANGYLTFDVISGYTFQNSTLPNAAAPNNLIAVFWDDLDPSKGGRVYYYTDQTKGRFIVEYQAVPHYDYYGVADAPETFQVILYPDGRIVYQYQTVSDSLYDTNGCTVGIEDSAGMTGLQVSRASSAYPKAGLAVEFTYRRPWLSLSPRQGTVSPGESQEVQVAFDASELVPGTYRGRIVIFSNDADEGEIKIPVTLTVGAGSAAIDSGDYNGDGSDEIAVFRPASGAWFIRGMGTVYFGRTGDCPVPADYNGDGKTDIAIFRPDSGLWAVRNLTRRYFGRSGDLPVPGDYDGDETAAPAIFRSSAGLWAMEGGRRLILGSAGDWAVPGDYNGQGRKDPAIFRAASGLWAVAGVTRFVFGGSGNVPLVNDFDGDGDEEAAVFSSGQGTWTVRGVAAVSWAVPGALPVSLDLNGCTAAEPAFFQPATGLWSVRGLTACYYGVAGDIPVTR